jgi:hypothetical protein
MPKSYSSDSRKHVIEAIASRVSWHKAVELLGRGEHSSKMGVAPKPHGGEHIPIRL